jgi:hypothetical protein
MEKIDHCGNAKPKDNGPHNDISKDPYSHVSLGRSRQGALVYVGRVARQNTEIKVFSRQFATYKSHILVPSPMLTICLLLRLFVVDRLKNVSNGGRIGHGGADCLRWPATVRANGAIRVKGACWVNILAT